MHCFLDNVCVRFMIIMTNFLLSPTQETTKLTYRRALDKAFQRVVTEALTSLFKNALRFALVVATFPVIFCMVLLEFFD